jgi:type VI secretion system protein
MADSGRKSLLSRIASGNLAPVDEEHSILGHLQSLLNTRQGDSPCVPGYGVIDFADVVHGFPGTVQQLSKCIRATILEFEPRLKNVTVRHIPDETLLTLRFEISAQLVRAKGNRTLRVNTTVRPGGRVDVA